MARQSSVGWACGWLVSIVFWLWIEKKLWFPGPFSKRKMKMRVHIRMGSTCVFRVRGVIVHMPYLSLRKVLWANSIWSMASPVSNTKLVYVQIFDQIFISYRIYRSGIGNVLFFFFTFGCNLTKSDMCHVDVAVFGGIEMFFKVVKLLEDTAGLYGQGSMESIIPSPS